MSEEIIRLQDVSKIYSLGGKRGLFSKGNEQNQLHAVDGVSLTVSRGEIFGVVGESGCGKSTLGRCVMKLIPVSGGRVFFKGEDITDFDFQQMKTIRAQMQMIFQNPFSSFNPKHSVGKGLRNLGKLYDMQRDELDAQLEQLMGEINLDMDLLDRYPNELSGGQLQRLAIARALMLNPEFLMADEPTSALDVSIQAQIINLLLDLQAVRDLTIMLVSHELAVVEHVCDKVLVMYLGAVMEMGDTKKVFSNLLHPYTQALLSARPKEDPDARTERIELEGDIISAMGQVQGCRLFARCPQHIQGVCDTIRPELKEVESDHWVACHLQGVQSGGVQDSAG